MESVEKRSGWISAVTPEKLVIENQLRAEVDCSNHQHNLLSIWTVVSSTAPRDGEVVGGSGLLSVTRGTY